MKSIKVLCLILVFTLLVVEYNEKFTGEITPLHQAAEEGDIEQAKTLISRGVGVNVKNFVGNTPLHMAARNGHKDIVELLVRRGADVNAKNISGRTPLHYTAMRGHIELSKLLISKGPLSMRGIKPAVHHCTMQLIQAMERWLRCF